MGEPKHLNRYCGKLAPSLTCLVCEDEAAHRAYGLREGGLRELASLNVGKSAFRLVRNGVAGGVPSGNVRMMPGTFIVDTNGKIVHAHYNQDIADHIEFDHLLTLVNDLS